MNTEQNNHFRSNDIDVLVPRYWWLNLDITGAVKPMALKSKFKRVAEKKSLIFIVSIIAEKASSILKESPDLRKAYSQLKNVADKWLKHSAYSDVNLTKLFEGLSTLR